MPNGLLLPGPRCRRREPRECVCSLILAPQPRRDTHFATLERAITDSGPATLEDMLPVSKHPGPRVLAEAAELENLVRTAVKPLPDGEECLDAMLDHEPPDDPVHRVYRTRDNTRQRVRLVLA